MILAQRGWILGQSWPKLEGGGPNFADSLPTFVDLGQLLADSGSTSANLVDFSPYLAQSQPESAEFGRCPKFGQLWPERRFSVQPRPSHVWAMLAGFAPMRAEFGSHSEQSRGPRSGTKFSSAGSAPPPQPRHMTRRSNYVEHVLPLRANGAAKECSNNASRIPLVARAAPSPRSGSTCLANVEGTRTRMTRTTRTKTTRTRATSRTRARTRTRTMRERERKRGGEQEQERRRQQGRRQRRRTCSWRWPRPLEEATSQQKLGA